MNPRFFQEMLRPLVHNYVLFEVGRVAFMNVQCFYMYIDDPRKQDCTKACNRTQCWSI